MHSFSKTFQFQAFQFSQTVLFQTIQFSISIRFFVYLQLNVKTILFQEIQFSLRTQFSSIWSIDRTLSSATTLGQSGPWSSGNAEVLCIPRTSLSDFLVSYSGHSLYMGVLPLCIDAVGVFYSLSWLGNIEKSYTHTLSLSLSLYIYIYSNTHIAFYIQNAIIFKNTCI